MAHDDDVKILTLNDGSHCLLTPAEAIADSIEGRADAHDVVLKLKTALKPKMPAAGLAAPQIGISKQVFIFAWDRKPEHLEAVINPSFIPDGDEKQLGFEGCFSVPLALANVPRFQHIQATYMNGSGQIVTYRLSGFAARVFQHEYDHLQGVENIHRPDAEVKNFASVEALMSFIAEVKRGDVVNYVEPVLISAVACS